MSGQQPWAGGPPQSQEPPQTPPPKRSRRAIPAVLVIVFGTAVAWFIMGRKGQEPVTPAAPEPVAARPTTPAPTAPSIPVAESDARVRDLARGLSSEPEFAKWLGTEGLIQRFTAAVGNIAEGESPRMVLSFLAPAQGFQVNQNGGRAVMNPSGYERYDTVGRVFGSFDAPTAAKVYGELKPLIDGAYAEIAPPGQTFDKTFSRAIEHLLAVPVPQGDVALEERGALFAYADPQLEGLSRAQKHLLRMGPKNMQAIQSKLRELQGALNLPAAGQ